MTQLDSRNENRARAFSAGPILDGLLAAAHAGLDVRVIIDKSQEHITQKFMTALQAAGAKVLWSDPQFSFMHAKVMIVDDATAIVSTGNYAATQLATERNYVMTDTDASDAASLGKLFDADFARTAPDLACTRLLSAHGIEGRRMLAPKVHVKSILVDGKLAYAGSENLSQTSLDKNREVGLVVTEAKNVAKMRATFETDWATATAF